LCAATPAADHELVFLFALFHDARRVNEVVDPGHGRRGAELARRLHGELFEVGAERLATLLEACAEHTETRSTADPAVGVCFDSDRLNLWRVGITPAPEYLSTLAALDEELQEWSNKLHGRARDWEALNQAYTA
jgi:uncharacterized protein